MSKDKTSRKPEGDVAEERDQIEDTIDEIRHRLSPGQLFDEVLRHGRGSGSDVAANLGRTLTANPVPTALIGVGLLWLLLERGKTPADTQAVQKDRPAEGEQWQI